MDDITDAPLDAAIAGDRAAQALILERHHDYIRRTMFRLLGRTPDLDDLVQTVMERILAALPTYRRESSLTTWIGGICVHVMKDHLRKRRVRSVVQSSDELYELGIDFPGASNPEKESELREILGRAERALDALSPEQRAVFVLRVVEGYSIEEVAAMTKSARSTTRMRLYWGRKAFYKALEASLGADAPRTEPEPEAT